MNLVAKSSGGANIVGRPQARPQWYPAPSVLPVQVKVAWTYEDESPAAARLIGIFRPGQIVDYPYNPLTDRNVVIYTISIAADGTPSAREWADAYKQTLVFQRETAAPTLAQFGESTHTLIRLAIDGFSTLAIRRRVRTADNEAMTVNLSEEITDVAPGEVLSRVIDLTRGDSDTGTRTVWVRVSHSSGGDLGAESVATSFVYADDVGAGGGSGDEEPFPHREYTIM